MSYLDFLGSLGKLCSLDIQISFKFLGNLGRLCILCGFPGYTSSLYSEWGNDHGCKFGAV